MELSGVCLYVVCVYFARISLTKIKQVGYTEKNAETSQALKTLLFCHEMKGANFKI